MSRLGVHKDKLLQTGYVVGAFASIWSVIIALLMQLPSLPWGITAVIASVIVFPLLLWAVVAVIKSDAPTKIFRVADQIGIRNYLYRWISNGGRVAVWTRDMSWANDPEIDRLLLSKAQAGELIICLPRAIEKSDYLRDMGAEVVVYGLWDAPAISFTIINYNRAGSRVAVGRAWGDKHIIQEFSDGEHPAFHMAQDLVRMVRERPDADR